MKTTRNEQKAALQSSLRAVTRLDTRGKPKIGVEEFMSVAERFGLPTGTLKTIRAAVQKAEWGSGPFLGNYYAGLRETKVEAFERAARKAFGAPYAVGTSSGTGALHSAFVAAGVGPGKEVICSAIGFCATAAAVVLAKGVPVFCDVDESLSMDPRLLTGLINSRTAAIAPTHVMGTVCDMRAIMRVARKHRLPVVEDCAQSCGGAFQGKRVGTFGDLGCFSISCYKIVGGGEGGLVLARNKRLWERVCQTVESGGLWRPERFAPPRYEGELFCGSNYRMSELEAAIDTVQMKRMPTTVRRSNAVKLRILRRLKTFREITPQKLNDPEGDVGYLLRFYPETFELGTRIVKALRGLGIGAGMRGPDGPPDWHVYSYMYPVTLQSGANGPECVYTCPHYTQAGGAVVYSRGDCPNADDLFDRVITIPLNQWYSAQDCRLLADTLNEILRKYCREDAGACPWL